MLQYLEETRKGRKKVNFKLRDWVFLKTGWGEPIPIVHCEKCGAVALDESQLPLELPDVDSYEPTENGESPLAKMTDWVNTTCPKCGGLLREKQIQCLSGQVHRGISSDIWTRTMIENLLLKRLLNIGHLLIGTTAVWSTQRFYLHSRFWHKFLYDIGVVPTPEPYQKRTSHWQDSRSKRRKNV